LTELAAIKFPSQDSLHVFYEDICLALDNLEKANKDVTKFVLCGSALQLMLNFPHAWMGQSGTADRFVEIMTEQAKNFVELKAKADASLG
jgi:hypothetical protein